MTTPSFPDRREMLAKVHIARKDLCLDDDTYRAVLLRTTGKDSSGACQRRQLVDLLDEFKRLGWSGQPAAKGARKESGKPHVRKVFALWEQMCRDGIPAIANRAGLLAFVKRQTAVDDPEWLSPVEANKVIEGLKAWRARVLRQRGTR